MRPPASFPASARSASYGGRAGRAEVSLSFRDGTRAKSFARRANSAAMPRECGAVSKHEADPPPRGRRNRYAAVIRSGTAIVDPLCCGVWISGFARCRSRPGMTEAIQPKLRRPCSLRRGVRRFPFSVSPERGMERREGARGLRGPFGQPLRSGRPRALRGRAPRVEVRGCAPLALHPQCALSAHRLCSFARRPRDGIARQHKAHAL